MRKLGVSPTTVPVSPVTWTIVAALPGLNARGALDANHLSIIPVTDPRCAPETFDEFARVSRYLRRFRTIKCRPVPSLLMVRRVGTPKPFRNRLTLLRNILAISTVVLARARRSKGKFSRGPTFSDVFDFPAAWLKSGRAGLLVETPVVLGNDDQSSFCGHPAPAYPYGTNDSYIEWDAPLAGALLALFESRRKDHRHLRRRVERVLEIAYLALRAPSDNLRSGNDWGVSLALLVSAFESLANVAGSVDIEAVRTLIDGVPWSKRLRRRLAPYEYRSPNRRRSASVFRPLKGMTRPVQIYARLYRARNMVLHGEDYERNRLEPGRRNASWGYLQFESAAVFRCVLLHVLAGHGYGTYLVPPSEREAKRLGLAAALDRHLKAGFHHDPFYESLGCGQD